MEFGFASVGAMLLYLRREAPANVLTLAVLPMCIFLLSGIMLRHWLLMGFSILFAVGQIYIAVSNITMSNEARGNDDI